MVSDIKSSALGRSEPLKHTVRYTHCLYCEHHDMSEIQKYRHWLSSGAVLYVLILVIVDD